jgi:hypothetical protein
VDLADQLYHLLQNPDRIEDLGRKGQEVVHSRFHAGRMAEETLAVYRQYMK